MSRATPGAIDPGQSSAADLNAVFDAFATASADIDRDNWQDEGLDGRSLEADVQHFRAFDLVEQTTAGLQAGLSSSWVTLNAGTSMRSGGPTFNLADDEVMVVEGFVEFLSDGAGNGVPASADVQVRIAFRADSLTGSVNSSVRPIKADATNPASGSADTMAVIPGPQPDFEWAELQISDQNTAATVQVGRALLRGRVYRRV